MPLFGLVLGLGSRPRAPSRNRSRNRPRSRPRNSARPRLPAVLSFQLTVALCHSPSPPPSSLVVLPLSFPNAPSPHYPNHPVTQSPSNPIPQSPIAVLTLHVDDSSHCPVHSPATSLPTSRMPGDQLPALAPHYPLAPLCLTRRSYVREARARGAARIVRWGVGVTQRRRAANEPLVSGMPLRRES